MSHTNEHLLVGKKETLPMCIGHYTAWYLKKQSVFLQKR